MAAARRVSVVLLLSLFLEPAGGVAAENAQASRACFIEWWGDRSGAVLTQEEARTEQAAYEAFVAVWGWLPGVCEKMGDPEDYTCYLLFPGFFSFYTYLRGEYFGHDRYVTTWSGYWDVFCYTCEDADEDGYGDPGSPACPHPERDCDDLDPGINPGAVEGPEVDPTCSDALDNNCDGDLDLADHGCRPCADNDRDGYGSPSSGNCPQPEEDCDDTNPEQNPGRTEEPYGDPTCSDGMDNNCDGLADLDDPDCVCNDGDDDGYGDPASPLCRFAAWDCDDSLYGVSPGQEEGPYGSSNCSDGLDNDCNGLADMEDPECICNDGDGDGYGWRLSPLCPHPEPDCDDSDPNVNPGMPEIPGNGLDDDCDPNSPPWGVPASTLGDFASVNGQRAAVAVLLLLPAAVVLAWKRRRRTNRA